MNGVNLEQFQFEFDLTWMSFFQNEAGRTYTRYGGREDHDAESHLNKASLLRVMEQVLVLHKDGKVQPANRYEPVASKVRTPEDIPPMKGMMAKRKVSCIHCHDVKGAQLLHLEDLGKLEKKAVYTYPAPSRLGIHLDTEKQYLIVKVDARSAAAAAGIRSGDYLRTIDQQRILTHADVTRVLELAPETGSLKFGIERARKTTTVSVRLPQGWRANADPSWRSSTGLLGPGSGFWGKKANSGERKKAGVADDDLAIKVTFIWGKWIKQADLRLGDVITSIDGQKNDMTIRQLQAYLHLNHDWGDSITLVRVRNGKEKKLSISFPKERPN